MDKSFDFFFGKLVKKNWMARYKQNLQDPRLFENAWASFVFFKTKYIMYPSCQMGELLSQEE